MSIFSPLRRFLKSGNRQLKSGNRQLETGNLLILLVLLLSSCNQVVRNTNIPEYRVSFIIDVSVSGTDNQLRSIGNVKIYTTTSPAMQSYGVGAYGYSGVAVTRGLDDQIYAFDICCPHEAQKDIVLEEDGFFLTCGTCGSSFQIFDGSGYPVEGQCLTTQPLKRYGVSTLGVDRYLIRNDSQY